jgi:RNA polymerase-binding transcription factor DksA
LVDAQRRLADLDAAAQRLQTGTYGSCIRCGQPIGAERLEALPTAVMCVHCAALPKE